MAEHNINKEYVITETQITNEEYIRIHWTVQQLAEMLIKSYTEVNTDYDWDENPIPGYEETYYITSDNMEFSDYDEALHHEIWWLRQKYAHKKDEEVI